MSEHGGSDSTKGFHKIVALSQYPVLLHSIEGYSDQENRFYRGGGRTPQFISIESGSMG